MVLQVQEQGHHGLLHLGSQAAQLLACHRRHQVPEQCHGRCPDLVPLLQGRVSEPSQTHLGTLDSQYPQQDPFIGAPGTDLSLPPRTGL